LGKKEKKRERKEKDGYKKEGVFWASANRLETTVVVARRWRRIYGKS
jgi:hypothetical protein